MIEIKIEDVEKAFLIISEYFKKQNKTKFKIDNDYYWNIPEEIRYDNYTEPKEFTLGQLSDDWNEVSKLLTHESEPVGLSLVWLSNVLRYVGEKTVL